LVLSATMPNVEDFKTWLSKLNGKVTEVINSSWRPTKLNWHFVPFNPSGYYSEVRDRKINVALELVMQKPDEKYLVFVHDKTTGRLLTNKFNNMGIECEFHNGDLGLQERLQIEGGFRKRENGLRVMVATSTVAWGVNLPARNVVIVGTHRGINEVDELDIIQMSGRAGRYMIDPEGDCFLITENPGEWAYRVKNPRPVLSTLLDPGILGFHILAEVMTRNVTDRYSLDRWFERTLAKIQQEVRPDLVEEVLDKLQKWEMLVITEGGEYRITRLGAVSANLYYLPQDIYSWAVNFSQIENKGLWESDLALSWAIGSAPSWDIGYVPKDADERVRKYMDALKEAAFFEKVWPTVIASDLYDHILGLEKRITVRNIQFDAARICQALSAIDRAKGWNRGAFWKSMELRLKYGATAEVAELCVLPGVGVVRASKLYDRGIKSLADFRKRENSSLVKSVLGEEIAKNAKAWLKTEDRLQKSF
jgi:replicative superfamily II helicase